MAEAAHKAPDSPSLLSEHDFAFSFSLERPRSVSSLQPGSSPSLSQAASASPALSSPSPLPLSRSQRHRPRTRARGVEQEQEQEQHTATYTRAARSSCLSSLPASSLSHTDAQPSHGFDIKSDTTALSSFPEKGGCPLDAQATGLCCGHALPRAPFSAQSTSSTPPPPAPPRLLGTPPSPTALHSPPRPHPRLAMPPHRAGAKKDKKTKVKVEAEDMHDMPSPTATRGINTRCRRSSGSASMATASAASASVNDSAAAGPGADRGSSSRLVRPGDPVFPRQDDGALHTPKRRGKRSAQDQAAASAANVPTLATRAGVGPAMGPEPLPITRVSPSAKRHKSRLQYGLEQHTHTTVKKASDRSSGTNTLVGLAQGFVDLLKNARGEAINLKDAAVHLDVPKRRIYDITNVMEGIGLITKSDTNKILWTPAKEEQKVTPEQLLERRRLETKLKLLDLQLEELETQSNDLTKSLSRLIRSDESDDRLLRLTHDDLKASHLATRDGAEQALLCVRAPDGTTMTVPDPYSADGRTQIFRVQFLGELKTTHFSLINYEKKRDSLRQLRNAAARMASLPCSRSPSSSPYSSRIRQRRSEHHYSRDMLEDDDVMIDAEESSRGRSSKPATGRGRGRGARGRQAAVKAASHGGYDSSASSSTDADEHLAHASRAVIAAAGRQSEEQTNTPFSNDSGLASDFNDLVQLVGLVAPPSSSHVDLLNTVSPLGFGLPSDILSASEMADMFPASDEEAARAFSPGARVVGSCGAEGEYADDPDAKIMEVMDLSDSAQGPLLGSLAMDDMPPSQPLSPFASFGGGSDDTFLMSLRSDEGLTDLFGDDDWVDGSGPL